jgi:hypothetical protein
MTFSSGFCSPAISRTTATGVLDELVSSLPR